MQSNPEVFNYRHHRFLAFQEQPPGEVCWIFICIQPDFSSKKLFQFFNSIKFSHSALFKYVVTRFILRKGGICNLAAPNFVPLQQD